MNKGFETNVVVEVEKAVVVRMDFKEFEGDVRQWQELFFKVLTWKNTFSLAYEVDVQSYRDNSAFVKIVAKQEIEDQLVDWLKSIGYNKVKTEEVEVGVLGIYADADVYKYYCEW